MYINKGTFICLFVCLLIFFWSCYFQSRKTIQQSKHVSVDFPGLIADKFGNYMPAFLIAGGVGVLASFIPFVLQCIKKENSSDNNRMEYLEELMDMEQNEVTKKEAKSDDLSKTTVLVEMVPTNPVVVRTSNKLITPRRPISFMWAMESPFHPSPS